MKTVLIDSPANSEISEKLLHVNYSKIIDEILKSHKFDKNISWFENFKRILIQWFTEFYEYYGCTYDFATLINSGLTYRWDRPPVRKEVMDKGLNRLKS